MSDPRIELKIAQAGYLPTQLRHILGVTDPWIVPNKTKIGFTDKPSIRIPPYLPQACPVGGVGVFGH